MLSVNALYVYPIKSCRGIEVSAAWLGEQGLAGDRRWMVVDENGRMLTARKVPELLKVQPVPDETGIWLTAPGCPDRPVLLPREGAMMTVEVWQDRLSQARVSEPGSQWFSEYLGQPVRLVWLPPVSERMVDPEWAPAGHFTGFADGFPILVAHQASLQDLSRRVGMTLSMRRFRPNLVVAGGDPWDEDRWTAIESPGAALRLSKPCSRCIMITVDPDTFERQPEVLRGLAQFRRQPLGVIFGKNAVVTRPGLLAVGESLDISED
ncbi:MAG: MOSC domain-containing protein [Gammaproteobacteria bacterium]|nr:MAG: MOSC domain-containing protein [Gammaproteobacteria bacterium]